MDMNSMVTHVIAREDLIGRVPFKGMILGEG
jgi:hypothetical protein